MRAVADVLRDAGDVVVIWGERVAGGERGSEALEALLAVAGAIGIDGKQESGLIEVPAAGNGRGLREVGCLPTLEPGLADAAATGMTVAEMAEGGDLATVLLFEAGLPDSALDAAASVIAFSQFRSDALDEHADVVFPAAVYAEKEGTVTHPDGRIQRVRQALGHPKRGARRLVGAGGAVRARRRGHRSASSSAVTAALAEAVPFYTGITLDEIGGQGVRWQEREAAAALASQEPSTAPLAAAAPAPEGLRAGHVATFWAGPKPSTRPRCASSPPGRGPSCRWRTRGPREWRPATRCSCPPAASRSSAS